MTTIPPILGPITAGDFGTFRRPTDTTPFTNRSAVTYQDLLENLRRWAEKLPGDIDANLNALEDSWIDNAAGITTGVTEALNAAVQQVVTADIPITAALFRTMGFLVAPPPSGGDDTAAIQPLLLAAQSTSGTLYLQAGTYRLNLATAQSFNQPKLVGAGKQYTKLAPFDKTKPVVVFQGGSGGESGGYLSDLSFVAHSTGGGLGLALQDVCDVQWDRLRFDSLDEAIIFAVTQPGGFTEFCRGEATIQAGTGIALHYTTVKTAETSFHGSGLTGGIINFSGPYAVQIEDHCFPYSAPLSVTVFSHGDGSQVIRNRNASREVSFFGTLRLEHQGANYVALGAVGDGHNNVLYVGTLTTLNGPVYLGRFYLLDSLNYLGGNTIKNYKPYTQQKTTVNGATAFDLNLDQGEFAKLYLNIIGPNFGYHAECSVWRNPNTDGGTVTKITDELYNNGSGAGSATLAVAQGALTITNNYPGYTATVTVVQQGGRISDAALRQ